MARWFAGAAVLLLAACASVPSADVAVRNVTIYAGDERAPFVGSVAIKDGKFVTVVPGDIPIQATRVIDGSGKFLTPGLWDMHVHLRGSESGGLDLAAFRPRGITSVRDLGSRVERAQAAQRETANGQGPAIYSSYSTLNGKAFGAFQRAVTTEAELRTAIEELAKSGAAQIKIHKAFLPTLLPAAVRLAHARGLKLTGHIPLGLHPLQACEQGMDGIEHVGSFLEAYISVTPGATADSAIAYLESDAAAPLYRCLASRGVAVTPTLVLYPAVALSRGKGKMPDGADMFIAGMQRIVLRLHRAGITLVAGTDVSDVGDLPLVEGVSLLDELAMLQAAELAPRAVISAATANAARVLGVDDRVGTIDAGKVADFLLLDTDPGKDVQAFRALAAVYRHGK
jgi:imidazolonepropionase-like amidohydrolase